MAGRSRYCLLNLPLHRCGRRLDQHCIRAGTDHCADTGAWNAFDTATRYTSTAICETRNDSKRFEGVRTIAYPLQSHPHDADVGALLRIAVVWNVPFACNRATADLMISSPYW